MTRTFVVRRTSCVVRAAFILGLLLGLRLTTHDARLLAQDTARGKAVYEKWCAGCHGDTGAGDGVAAKNMLPPPRDFTPAKYQIRTTASGELPTDADLERVIAEGMPGTAMPEWKTKLSDGERKDVVAYIKTFSTFFEGAAPAVVDFGRAPSGGANAIADGRKVFEKLECFKCHGMGGRGDGKSAPTLKDDWDFPIFAANLTQSWHFNGGSSVEDIYRRMRTGLDGTPMPSFSDAIDGGIITQEQLWHVAQYVNSLSPSGSAPPLREVVRAVPVDSGAALPSGPGDSTWARAEATFIPLMAQIIAKPRWFAPAVTGVWVQAMHNGNELAVLVSWDDRSKSPDKAWDEWMARLARSVTDADGALPAGQGPDRLWVQFPKRVTDDAERPYFLGGTNRRPVYLWRWMSTPDSSEEGTGTGLGSFTPFAFGSEVGASASYAEGRWRVQFSRALVPVDTAGSPTFQLGRAIPIAFFAADGSNGETGTRGAVSAWYAIYLDLPTPPGVYVAPVVAVLLTAGLGFVVLWRAQRQNRSRELLGGVMNRLAKYPLTLLFAAAGATQVLAQGAVSGTVKFTGAPPANPKIDMTEEPTCKAKYTGAVVEPVVTVNKGGLANAFIYVKTGLPAGAKHPAPATPAVIDQSGCLYKPRVFGVMTGQNIEIRNSDAVLHNIKAVPKKNRGFNISQPTQGMKTTRSFPTAELAIPFECNVHGWMHAKVFVLDNPYFAVSDDNGAFSIKGLPPGTYTLEAWHEKFGTKTATVTVTATGGTAAFTFAAS